MICDAKLVWQDIEMSLPRSWEMVRYGMNYDRGACVFFDELDERLLVAWERKAKRPDFDRLCSDLRARETAAYAESPDGRVAPEFLDLAGAGEWRGLAIASGGEVKTRAARYFTEAGALLETTIFWKRERDVGAERALLSAVRPVDSGGWRAWRAFGIDAEIPADMKLVACRCLPGDTQWEFRGRSNYPWTMIRRMAFPDIWLKEPLRDWLQRQPPGGSSEIGRTAHTAGAVHDMTIIATRRARGKLGPVTGARVFRHDYACVCPREKRVYHAATEVTAQAPIQLLLRCECGDLLRPPPGHSK